MIGSLAVIGGTRNAQGADRGFRLTTTHLSTNQRPKNPIPDCVAMTSYSVIRPSNEYLRFGRVSSNGEAIK